LLVFMVVIKLANGWEALSAQAPNNGRKKKTMVE